MRKLRKVRRPRVSKTKPGKIVCARISHESWRLLESARLKNKRTLSREIAARLDDTLGRITLPPHVRALADAVAWVTWMFENKTGRRWNVDQFTSRHLAWALGRLVTKYTLPGKFTIPPNVTDWAKPMPPGARKDYLARFGEVALDGVIAWFKGTPPPQPEQFYPEWYMEFYRIERDLSPRRHT
jgi:hypothetical protein